MRLRDANRRRIQFQDPTPDELARLRASRGSLLRAWDGFGLCVKLFGAALASLMVLLMVQLILNLVLGIPPHTSLPISIGFTLGEFFLLVRIAWRNDRRAEIAYMRTRTGACPACGTGMPVSNARDKCPNCGGAWAFDLEY